MREKITNSEKPGESKELLPSDRSEKITTSKSDFENQIETITNSRTVNSEKNEKVTKSIKSRNEAIELAKKILKHKKSARQTVAKLLSELYSNPISFDDINKKATGNREQGGTTCFLFPSR